MLPRWICSVLLATPVLAFGDPLADALAAEQRMETARALELFLALERERPNDPLVLQKIARQYSDLVADQPTAAEKRAYAQQALRYSERAVALQPNDPVNVLSVAISHAKLGLYSDTRTKVAFSRLVKQDAERALALDPQYAFAHHVLGRWHLEVSELGATARFFVRLFYGGLPNASPAEAERHLRRAVELEPAEPSHVIELGYVLAALGRREEAAVAWRRGLELPRTQKHHDAAFARARAALATSN